MTVMSGRGPGGQMVMGGHYGQSGHHTGVHVCLQCCNIIAMSLYCKDDKCYYSAASLHHSAAALVICFHCDAREQLQK